MKQFSILPAFCLLFFSLNAQDIEDPSLRKPYRLVVQTGIALQWSDEQFKSFSLSVERPLNLYNHFGLQANFYFPNGNDYGYYYRTITSDSWEVGVFSKTFFHGRLTGRRSKAYFGPDVRFGRRTYRDSGPFDGTFYEPQATTFKFMARLGWQYHLGPAVVELAFPFGFEKENFSETYTTPPSSSSFYYSEYPDQTWFIMAPSFSIGIGF
jgi:hypothetical protein